MSRTIPTIRLFVAHAFEPRSKAYNRKDFKEVIARVIRSVQDKGVAKIIATYGVAFDETVMSEALVNLLRACDIGLIELSDNNPNVLYEYGFLVSAAKPTVLVRSSRAGRRGPDLPSDIKGRMFVEYEDLGDLEARVVQPLIQAIERRQLSVEAMHRRLRWLWFPGEVQSIHVIAAHEYESVSSISHTSENYTLLDRFCDKDAVLEVVSLLSRVYPFARVVKYTDKEFLAGLALQENLVVVGGPGSESGATPGGNQVCRVFRTSLRSRISYSDDCEEMRVLSTEGLPFSAHTHSRQNGRTVEDWGYFACFPNPYMNSRRIVMLHGLHTFGVLGAALAFGDTVEGTRNVSTVETAFGSIDSLAFEVHFRVGIEQGVTLCPVIEPENLNSLATPDRKVGH